MEPGDADDEGGFVPHVSFRQAPGSSRYLALCRHCGDQAEAPHHLDVVARVSLMTRFLDDHRGCVPPPLPDA
jgi:hypothetical protein